jgi:hypothetical protein
LNATCTSIRNLACIAAKRAMDSTEKVTDVIDSNTTSSHTARPAEQRGKRVPPTRSPMLLINKLISPTPPRPHQQPCRILRARSCARHLSLRMLQHPMRAFNRAHLSEELQARGRHQGAERHHFSGLHRCFERPVQDEHHAEDQRHGRSHHGEMSRRLPTQFEPCASEPMQQEHQEITGDEVGGYRERHREIYYET